MSSGRYFSRADEMFPTAVLGVQAATQLGIGEIHGGEPPPQIRIGRSWFTVIGVLRAVPLSDDLDRAVQTGWHAAQETLGFDGKPTVMYIKALEESLEDVRDVLPATVFPEQPGQVQVSRPSDALAAKRATQNTYSSLFLGLAGVALLVGGVEVANTMVISVLERRREIGLRRAPGCVPGPDTGPVPHRVRGTGSAGRHRGNHAGCPRHRRLLGLPGLAMGDLAALGGRRLPRCGGGWSDGRCLPVRPCRPAVPDEGPGVDVRSALVPRTEGERASALAWPAIESRREHNGPAQGAHHDRRPQH